MQGGVLREALALDEVWPQQAPCGERWVGTSRCLANGLSPRARISGRRARRIRRPQPLLAPWIRGAAISWRGRGSDQKSAFADHAPR